MNNINGIPIIWDEQADKELLGGLVVVGANSSATNNLMANAFESGFVNSPFGNDWDKRLFNDGPPKLTPIKK